jgi:hypothetical protein
MTENIKSNIQTEDWISDLVGALTDPIICHRNNLDRPSEKYQQAITMQRLIENMLAAKEKCSPLGTDAECAWYLSTASLEAPLPSEWVRIYMYVFNKTCEFMNIAIPEDLIRKELNQYEMGLLLKLKHWLYRVRTENRKEKDRISRQDQMERLKQEEISLQPKMFEF